MTINKTENNNRISAIRIYPVAKGLAHADIIFENGRVEKDLAWVDSTVKTACAEWITPDTVFFDERAKGLGFRSMLEDAGRKNDQFVSGKLSDFANTPEELMKKLEANAWYGNGPRNMEIYHKDGSPFLRLVATIIEPVHEDFTTTCEVYSYSPTGKQEVLFLDARSNGKDCIIGAKQDALVVLRAYWNKDMLIKQY